MTLIEAIKSGKRFRRKGWNRGYLVWNFLEQSLELTFADAVADDWEIEEATVTITGTQFDTAYKRALDDYKEGLDLFADCLKRRLGL